MEIRKLSNNDVIKYRVALSKLMELCFASTYEKATKESLIDEKINSLLIHTENGSAYPLGAFDNDQLMGFVWAYPVSTPVEIVFHVAYIAVSADAQGNGVGRQLLKAVESTAKSIGLSSIELIVGSRNNQAVQFYLGNDFYEDRLIMRKDL